MSSDVAITVRHVSKHHAMFARPEDRLKQMVVPRLERLIGRPPRRYFRDFAALSDVSLEVRRGETVGIVGRNGSGKSTLLQIICGTLRPTAGEVSVNGRVAALLELGAGFNPDFTGRENVLLNAAILGLSRAEIDQRFDAIAAFADIGEFIDQPVRTYSSGMYVRLAFATAINVDPDILVVDEALAVGDEAFQRKCFARIEDIRKGGGTILLVSHSAQSVVQLCDRAVLLDAGEKLLDGAPKLVTGQYQRLMNATGADAQRIREDIRAGRLAPEAAPAAADNPLPVADLDAFDPNLKSPSRVDYDQAGATIRDVRIVNAAGRQVNILTSGGRHWLEYRVDFDRDLQSVDFGTLIKTTTGIELGGASTNLNGPSLDVVAGQSILVRMGFDCPLAPGTYFLNAGTRARLDGELRYAHRILDALSFRVVTDGPVTYTGTIDFGFAPEVTVLG